MFLLSCPTCKNKMKYAPVKKVAGSKKRCVFCGKTFTVNGARTDNIVKKI